MSRAHAQRPQNRPPDIVYGTTLDQLLKQVDDRNAAIQTMTAFVDVVACTGGASKGEVKCYPSFNGYIVIGKPRTHPRHPQGPAV